MFLSSQTITHRVPAKAKYERNMCTAQEQHSADAMHQCKPYNRWITSIPLKANQLFHVYHNYLLTICLFSRNPVLQHCHITHKCVYFVFFFVSLSLSLSIFFPRISAAMHFQINNIPTPWSVGNYIQVSTTITKNNNNRMIKPVLSRLQYKLTGNRIFIRQ